MINAIEIPKEQIPGMQFALHEVLVNEEARHQRFLDLETSMKLGNNHRSKIRIVFETTDGLKKVETTVWASTPECVVLKGGLAIPVHCIHEVFIY